MGMPRSIIVVDTREQRDVLRRVLFARPELAVVDHPVLKQRVPEFVAVKENQTTLQRTMKKVGRNETCPCGSGKKFKRCHEGGR
jgi:uncharacterized protein YchJ